MSIDTKLKEMGLVLPKATDPVGSYAVSYTHLTLPTMIRV